jgi:hypothetical protein
MFWNILDQPRQLLLKELAAELPVPGSYLAGGTALALLVGHRYSVDLDWFSPEEFNPGQLPEKLEKFGEVRVAETSRGTFHGWVGDIQVTWLYYPNPLLAPLVKSEDTPGLLLASLLDIGVMKWAAVSDRGARKDFFDLLALSQKGITFERMYPLLAEKFPKANINYYHMVKSLAYFDDAEREAMPVMLDDSRWEEVKEHFLGVHARMLKKLIL